MKYLDMHGVEIKAGDTIRCVTDGSEEKVYACRPTFPWEKEGLGINASNETYLKNCFGEDWELYREYYPLYLFNTKKEWEVIDKELI